MARCAAFRLSDLAPCGCRPKAGSDLCSNHQNFYEKEIWIERFLSRNSTKFLLGIDYPEHTFTRRIQNVVEHSLNSGRIVLTKDDIKRLPDNRDYADIFTVMVKTGKINPTWNKRLVEHSVRVAMRGLSPHLLDLHLPVLEQRIVPFLRSPFLNDRQFYIVIVSCLLCYRKNLEQVAAVDAVRYMENFVRELLNHPVMEERILTGSDYIKGLARAHTEEWNTTLLDTGFLDMLRQKQTALKAQKRARMMPHKEGIVKTVFHPDKVERWLEEGGEELVDMMFG